MTAHGMRGSRDRGHDTETSAVPTGPHGTAAQRYERHDGTRHDSSQTEAVRASVAAAPHDNMHTCMRRGTFPAHRLPRRRFWLRVRSKFQRTASSHGGVTGKLFSRGRRDLSPPQRSRRTRSEVWQRLAACPRRCPVAFCLACAGDRAVQVLRRNTTRRRARAPSALNGCHACAQHYWRADKSG